MLFFFSAYANSTNPFWERFKTEYLPELKEKGTRVIWSRSASKLYSNLKSHDRAGYQARADELFKFINGTGLSGLDIDIEGTYTWTQMNDLVGVIKALSTKIGPLSGTDKILIYDTNNNVDELFKRVHGYVSYVFLEAYGGGRGVKNLNMVFNGNEYIEGYRRYITPHQFVPGFSFYEEHGRPDWRDVLDERCYDYAMWQPPGQEMSKGGIFAYAIDRDIHHRNR